MREHWSGPPDRRRGRRGLSRSRSTRQERDFETSSNGAPHCGPRPTRREKRTRRGRRVVARTSSALERPPPRALLQTLPGAGCPRRAPPSGWRVPQSRRLLAPDGVAVRVREPDDAGAFDFPFQRRGLNGQAAHEAPSPRSAPYRGDTRRGKQLTLQQPGANVLPQLTVGQAGDHCGSSVRSSGMARLLGGLRLQGRNGARCHRFGRQGCANQREPAGGAYTLHPAALRKYAPSRPAQRWPAQLYFRRSAAAARSGRSRRLTVQTAIRAVCGSLPIWVKVMADSLSGRGTKGDPLRR
jgi:hypothetical protein